MLFPWCGLCMPILFTHSERIAKLATLLLAILHMDWIFNISGGICGVLLVVIVRGVPRVKAGMQQVCMIVSAMGMYDCNRYVRLSGRCSNLIG